MLAIHLKMNKELNYKHDISTLNGVGPKIKNTLNSIGLNDLSDLIFYFPRKYNDYRNLKKISDLKDREEVTIKGKILFSGLLKSRRKIYEVVINDGSGNFKITWFNPIYGYLKEAFKLDYWVVISGKVTQTKSLKIFQLINPSPDKYFISNNSDSLNNFASIHPIYSLTKGLTQNRLKKLIFEVIGNIRLDDFNIFSDDICKDFNLIKIDNALKLLHVPDKSLPIVDIDSKESIYKSLPHKSIIFYEFLLLCLGLKLSENKKSTKLYKQHKIRIENSLYKRILNNLPFSLTRSQNKVLDEIINDMMLPKQMNRLLQGDVGSGKTILALLSMAISYDNGFQSCLVAPTEILADQHYLYLKDFVPSEELVLLKSSLKAKEKKSILDSIKNGNSKFIVGTHSLFQSSVNYKNLGLIVIDEQHRFGVEQRKLMMDKGESSDMLIMTATPIPRTLSSILMTDYDVSIIDKIEHRERDVETSIIKKNQFSKLINFIDDELSQSRQAFFLCPLINKSSNEDFENLMDLKTLQNILKSTNLGKYKYEILHGDLDTNEKDLIMTMFRSGELNFIISTTVIEVGVDIPNANIMTIFNPERFGLSQLHQLRGRIGRGKHKSYCFLINDGNINEVSLQRIESFTKISDGFELAEKDLLLRGPGAFYGAGKEQSGNVWNLNFANIKRDIDILKDAKLCSDKIKSYSIYKNDKQKILKNIDLIWGKTINLTKIL
ncbi:ATP-dependent DNA helicase RecG [bacterium]|nr:ATP-dependent DNA helicase RecG [bacterium]